MIPLLKDNVQLDNWKHELKNSSISLSELLRKLNLSVNQFPQGLLANPEFKLKVTPSYLNKILPGDPEDPLLLQILPQALENKIDNKFSNDPVGDLDASDTPGLIQKYHGRALLITTQTCPIHCRYCFRKNFPYQQHRKLDQAFLEISKNSSISEIILSGGDPLSLSNNKIAEIFNKLNLIKHVKTIRIHTRYPSILPSRLDDGLLKIFNQERFNIVLVTHINHAQEIDKHVKDHLDKFRATVHLLNQSVLLKGVNDSLTAQIALSNSLLSIGVLPYYLHNLDRVQGSKHFEVTNPHNLYQQMQIHMPGYLLPKIVQELPGVPFKIPLLSK